MSDPATTTGTVEIPAEGGYRIDPEHSTISFVTRHVFGLAPVRGTFSLAEGHIEVAEPLSASSARATIPAASVDTRNAARDTTVRSAQYLDAENHPHIGFVSTGLSHGDGGWVLNGELTVRGVTRPLAVRVERASAGGGTLRLRASAEVDRYAFGITAMKGMTGRRLTMTLAVTAVRSPE
ncbi:YceI family protein [Prauserella flavalba]|uniref:Lipid/polyisoprenoid-binding YceI-like domain-containing protein n=1 Tax=Prauserella flavalba TaxID=1477506 RepID=A0A318LMI9_9PSEU|nr:YceI family protein [Prauserella flavalba]PXY35846.1 hypothetical protein BA062_10250 [Prauserella flavalba]